MFKTVPLLQRRIRYGIWSISAGHFQVSLFSLVWLFSVLELTEKREAQVGRRRLPSQLFCLQDFLFRQYLVYHRFKNC